VQHAANVSEKLVTGEGEVGCIVPTALHRPDEMVTYLQGWQLLCSKWGC
jgi:flavorubredoxin